MADTLQFLFRFLRSPRSVGAVLPSSRLLARKMVSSIEMKPGLLLVEFGPGTGALTREIAERLPARMRYLGIERDPAFVRVLRRRFPQLDFATGDVEDLQAILADLGLARADHILCGLPFASMPARRSEKILKATRHSLVPGGTFTTFQYIHAYGLPSARQFRLRMRDLFGERSVRAPVWGNVPPAYVLRWRAEPTRAEASPVAVPAEELDR